MYRQPHLLLQAIAGIVRQSMYRHKIIVVYSDGPRMGAEDDCADWSVNERGEAYRFCEDIFDAWMRCPKDDFTDVTWLDCTDDLLAAGPMWDAAADGAWKSNYGLKHVTTEWVAPAWDADYYPMPCWDHYMAKAMLATGSHGVYVSRFLAPDAPAVTVDASLPHHPAIYPGWGGYLTREALLNMAPGDDEIRRTSQWDDMSIGLNPQFWRMSDLHGSVPIPDPGHTPEWGLSRKAQDCGLFRIAHGRSFILHKYSIIGEAESVGA